MFFVHCSLNFWSTAHRDVLFTAITVQQFNGWKSLPRRHQLLCNSSNFTFYPSSCSVSLFLCIWHNRFLYSLSLFILLFSLSINIAEKATKRRFAKIQKPQAVDTQVGSRQKESPPLGTSRSLFNEVCNFCTRELVSNRFPESIVTLQNYTLHSTVLLGCSLILCVRCVSLTYSRHILNILFPNWKKESRLVV